MPGGLEGGVGQSVQRCIETRQARSEELRMRKTGVALAVAVASCAFGVVAAPALAFGTFRASIKGQTLETEPGVAKGHGEVEGLRLGPYTIECPKPVKATSKVNWEQNEAFFTELAFKECETVTKPKEGRGIEEIKKLHLTLAVEFLSNFAAKIGEGEGEVRIKNESSVTFKAGSSKCVVIIPAQSLPFKQKEGVEYEAGVPETEEEGPFEAGTHKFEKYGEFRKRLAFAIDLRRIKTKVEPNSRCRYDNESEEGKYNPETGYVEFGGGHFEGTLEEVTLANGSVWFEEE
jgi:hypothetical protein